MTRAALPIPTLTDVDVARFWQKVDKAGECWLWTGTISSQGYGRFSIARKFWQAHRVAWKLTVGPVPLHLEIDHLCRVKPCVNPAHLEPVTGSENKRRQQHRTGPIAEALAMRAADPFITATAVAERLGMTVTWACDVFRASGYPASATRREISALKYSLIEGMWHDDWTETEMTEAIGPGAIAMIYRLRQRGLVGYKRVGNAAHHCREMAA